MLCELVYYHDRVPHSCCSHFSWFSLYCVPKMPQNFQIIVFIISLAYRNELMMTTAAINEKNCEHMLSSTRVILLWRRKSGFSHSDDCRFVSTTYPWSQVMSPGIAFKKFVIFSLQKIFANWNALKSLIFTQELWQKFPWDLMLREILCESYMTRAIGYSRLFWYYLLSQSVIYVIVQFTWAAEKPFL